MMDDHSENFIEIGCAEWEKLTAITAFDIKWPRQLYTPDLAPSLRAIIDDRSAKILLHPIMRNYYHVRALECRTGLTAIARRGYVELVKL